MAEEPIHLDYQSPRDRRSVWLLVRNAILWLFARGAAIGLFIGLPHGIEVWHRYRAMKAAQSIYADLVSHPIPPGTLIFDASAALPTTGASTAAPLSPNYFPAADMGGNVVPGARVFFDPRLDAWQATFFHSAGVLQSSIG